MISNEIIEKGLKANPNMILNPNEEHVEKILMGLEKIDNKEYEIYLGFCGYASYYAVEK